MKTMKKDLGQFRLDPRWWDRTEREYAARYRLRIVSSASTRKGKLGRFQKGCSILPLHPGLQGCVRGSSVHEVAHMARAAMYAPPAKERVASDGRDINFD